VVALDQEHLQSILLDVLESGSLTLLLDAPDEGASTGIHYAPNGVSTLRSDSQIITDIDKGMGFNK
jgi:hypothetical protein